jgi:hypothetical protein
MGHFPLHDFILNTSVTVPSGRTLQISGAALRNVNFYCACSLAIWKFAHLHPFQKKLKTIEMFLYSIICEVPQPTLRTLSVLSMNKWVSLITKQVTNSGVQFESNSQDSVVSIVTRLRAGWPKNFGSIPGWCKILFLLKIAQTGSGANPADSVGTGRSSSAVKLPRKVVDHLSPYSVELKNEWSHNPSPTCSFVAFTGTAFPLQF